MVDFVLTSANQDLKLAQENAQEDAQNMIKYSKNKMEIQTNKTVLMVIKRNKLAITPIKIEIDGEVVCQKEMSH